MFAGKAILAVALVSVAFVQMNARPATEESWAKPFLDTLTNATLKMVEMVGDKSDITTVAKSSLNSYADNFKSALNTLSKTLEGKPGASDLVKETTKQWHAAVETYSKNIPETFNVKNLKEEYEQIMKTITDKSTELYKNSQGNADVEYDIKQFTKKQIEELMALITKTQDKLTEKKP